MDLIKRGWRADPNNGLILERTIERFILCASRLAVSFKKATGISPLILRSPLTYPNLESPFSSFSGRWDMASFRPTAPRKNRVSTPGSHRSYAVVPELGSALHRRKTEREAPLKVIRRPTHFNLAEIAGYAFLCAGS